MNKKHKYSHSIPSQYILQRISPKNNLNVTGLGLGLGLGLNSEKITKYSISQYNKESVIGLINSKGIFKYVNLNKKRHSLYQIFINNKNSIQEEVEGYPPTPKNEKFQKNNLQIRITSKWVSFQLFLGNRLLFISEYSNKIYQVLIPLKINDNEKGENEKISSSSSSSSSIIYCIGEHENFINHIVCSPYNGRTFITCDEHGIIKVWHISFIKKNNNDNDNDNDIPIIRNIWKIEVYREKTIIAQSALYHSFSKDKKIVDFLLMVVNENGKLKLYDLRKRELVKENYVEKSIMTIMKSCKLKYGEKNVVISANEIGTVYIWDVKMELISSIYLNIDNNKCVINDLCCFTDGNMNVDVLVVATTSLRKENHSLIFINIETSEVIKEFLFDYPLLFCSIVTVLRRGKEFLLVGNEVGCINAWSCDEVFNESKFEGNERKDDVVMEDEEPIPMEKPPTPHALSGDLSFKREKFIPFDTKQIPFNTTDEDLTLLELPRSNLPSPSTIGKQLLNDEIKKKGVIVIKGGEIIRRPGKVKSEMSKIEVVKHEKQSGERKQGSLFKKKRKKKKLSKKKVAKVEKMKIDLKSLSVHDVNYGNPKILTSVLKGAVDQKQLKEKFEEHRFAKRKVMTSQEFNSKMSKIESKQFNPKIVETINFDEKMKFKQPKMKFDNLLSLEVDQNKFTKKKRKVKKQVKKVYKKELKKRPNLKEYLFQDDFEQEVVFDYVYKPKLRLKTKVMDSILDTSFSKYFLK